MNHGPQPLPTPRFGAVVLGLLAPLLVVVLGGCTPHQRSSLSTQAQAAWPSTVAGHQPLAPGEHPRLFFRRSDLPGLRARAQTPEGQLILARLRFLLNGSDGRSLPEERRPLDIAFGKSEHAVELPPWALSLSHPMGYGFLYQITGDPHYADLSHQAMQLLLMGYRDKDPTGRYSFVRPAGPLRAGPSLGLVAMGYDMSYDGWTPGFRARVAQALEYYEYEHQDRPRRTPYTLENLAKGRWHEPRSNHWGMQVGGAALAALAITGDPEVRDQAELNAILDISRTSMRRALQRGFSPYGYFAEGDGTGSMASHIILLPALQAWRVSQGVDFIDPRPHAAWTTLKYILQTVPFQGGAKTLSESMHSRGGYPHNVWNRNEGVSGAGYFSMGYATTSPAQRRALWWFYRHYVAAIDEQSATPFDSTTYPHHAVLAFINTPFDEEPLHPSAVIPQAIYDQQYGFAVFRNRWQDSDDIVISQMTGPNNFRFRHGLEQQLTIWHHNQRRQWGSLPATVTHFHPAADGSAILGGHGRVPTREEFNAAREAAKAAARKSGDQSPPDVVPGEPQAWWTLIDFSGASGLDGLLIIMDGPASADDTESDGHQMEWQGRRLQLLGLGGKLPDLRSDEHGLHIGKQTLLLVDGQPELKVWAK